MSFLLHFSPLIAFWPFASGLMLLWAAAAALPILIHLWNRRRYRETTWAAMEYLLAAMKKNSRRIHVEQWLLLLIRVAILLLLAAAVADPFWPFLRSLTGALATGGQTHWVIVIDGSYSMDYRRGDESLFEKAKAQAAQVVAEGKQGDAFTLLLMGNPPQTIIADPAFDPGDVQDEIQSLRLSHGGANLSASLAEIRNLVGNAAEKHARLSDYRVCLFTDLGRNTWEEAASEPVARQLQSLAESGALLLFPLGDEGRENLVIESLALGSSLASLGRETTLTFSVHNLGEQPRTTQAKLLVDGRPVFERTIELAADETRQLEVRHQFETAGDHLVEAQLDDPRLEIDNHRYLSVPVRESIRALCVAGRRETAEFMQLNLNPFQAERPYVHAETADETALLERNLNDYDCLFVANLARFGRDEASVLRQFVDAGGGLVLFLGDRVQPEAYNEVLAAEERLLPARLGGLATGQFTLTALGKESPVVQPFVANPQSGLFHLPTHRYFRLEPFDEKTVRPALWFDSGDPALLEEKRGRGRVLLWATAASTQSLDRDEIPPREWTLLPLWRNYPVLYQQLLHAAVAGRNENRNVAVGEPLEDALYGVAAHVPLSLVSPGGRSERVPMTVQGEVNRWHYDSTWTSGVYEARYGAPLSLSRLYAVNLDTRESNLEKMERSELPPALQSDYSFEDLQTPSLPGKTRPELFRWVLGALLLLLLTETWLARRFGGSRS
ncbi:BatA domain-containing protein [Lignipirellula cremea]|uniref:VWFA domain-containing protein n=1 Tax=Lignipirellula cremea TaxID=2528010 RepID=A0A518DNF0_9BACT|nr:BatA domain-containing protein [Lignipirellula cremea]QDU93362.1 hypothetical protein Pla8534_11420 [Lignipirellula cremea]